MLSKRIIFRVFIFSTLAILGSFSPTLGSDKKGKPVPEPLLIQMELPQTEIPRPQFVCGYCHVLTYPSIVAKGYELWKTGKHNKYGCVECHYPPEKRIQNGSLATATAPDLQSQHIPKAPPERFSYLPLGGEAVQTRPRIVDASCMTSNCHGRPDDKFKTKKIKITEKVFFIHEPHLDKKKQIEGQQINCTNCHQHETEKKKFEVSKASCHLCHFTNVKFNEGRGRCELCHELPKKPIQTSGQEPITHEMLKKANVSCGGCHYELIQASGRAKYEAYFQDGVLKTTLILGAGYIKKENCVACHDQEKALKEADNKKVMHEKHVTVKTARCFDCHQPVVHKKEDLADRKKDIISSAASEKSVGERLMRDGFIRDSCLTCHPEPHRLQRLLAAGPGREGVPDTPGFHFNARATCMACHLEVGKTEKGERILKASANACVACHPGRKTLLQDWKKELDNFKKQTLEVEKEAMEALAKVKSKLPPDKLAEAKKRLLEGQETLNLVRYGNGVHNKKYAMYLLDAAMVSFEDLLDFLEE